MHSLEKCSSLVSQLSETIDVFSCLGFGMFGSAQMPIEYEFGDLATCIYGRRRCVIDAPSLAVHMLITLHELSTKGFGSDPLM